MISVLDGILSSYYRVCQTVPLAEEAADLFPHNREFWLKCADQEMGHDEVFKADMIESFGPHIEELIANFRPSPNLVDLLNWVNKEELNHLAYRYFLELWAVAPDTVAVRDFYSEYLPNFIRLHEDADTEHFQEVANMLLGVDIMDKIQYIASKII